MFGTIRRHQKWLWIVIITLTILSFVIFFSPYQRVSESQGHMTMPVCYLANRAVTDAEFDLALREVFIEFLCNRGILPDSSTMRQMGFNPEQATFQRLAMLEKAKEMKIHADEEAIKRLGANVVNRFRRENINSYNDFVARMLNPQTITGLAGRYQLSGADFERFARNELIIQQLASMSGLAGILVTPQEAEEVYRRQNEPLETQVVVFHASNYLASVLVTPQVLAEYYTNRMADYKIGERAILDYVRFPASNYLAEADLELNKETNLTQAINAEYLQRGTNAFPDAKTPEEAKTKIREEFKNEIALKVIARRAANQFTTQVFAEETNRLARFHALAAPSNLVVRTTEPFVIETDAGPKEFSTPPGFTNLLSRLSLTDPVASTAIVGKDAVYVVALVRRIPSEDPPFERVQERVAEDYKSTQSLLAAQAAGAAAAATIEKERAAGKSFEEACAAAKVAPVKLPAFAMSVRSDPEIERHINLGLLQESVFGMSPGETTPFRSTPEGGFILHLASRLPLDPQKVKDELPQFTAQMRQGRVNETLSGWYRKLEESGYLQPARQAEPKSQPASSPPPSPSPG